MSFKSQLRHLARLLYRAVCVVFTVMVSSYIFFFEVLDLDSSEFSSKLDPNSAYAIQTDSKDAERSYLAKLPDLGSGISLIGSIKEAARFYRQLREDLRPVRFDSARSHGYRAALPRSSISPPFRLSKLL